MGASQSLRLRIFDLDVEPVAPRTRSNRYSPTLIGRLAGHLVILAVAFTGGLVGAVCYNIFFEKPEIKSLKRSVDTLRQELGNARLSSTAKSGDAATVSKTVTDKKGNLFDVFVVD